jgi:hypothetical protein
MKNYLKSLLVTGAFLANLSIYADLEPYSSIQNLPPTPYFVQDAYTYFSLIMGNGASVVIDVESPDGGVARYIAQQAANLPTVTEVYSVSLWQSADRSQKHLYQRFLSNVNQEMTTQLITPIRMSSQEGAEALKVTADFISVVGGNDSTAIYNDILSWYPHLSDKGILCGNNWLDSSVQVGVTKAADSLDVKLHINNNVWYFQKGM